MKPCWIVVALDVTQYFTDEALLKKTGRVWALYLFDRNRHVHLCELTPSYELNYFDFVTENEIDDSTHVEMIDAMSEEDVAYYHTRVIDGYSDEWFHHLGEFDQEWGPESYEEELEQMMEWCRGNPPHPTALLEIDHA